MTELEKISIRAMEMVEQEPCDKCKYFDGNSCQHYDYKVGYTQGYEDANNRFGQEPCEDAISRDAVYEILMRSDFRDTCSYETFKKRLDALPSVTPKPTECQDAISRADRLLDLANAIESDDSGYWTNKRISPALRNISSVTQKSGKWIDHSCEGYVCKDMLPKQICFIKAESVDKE